MILHLHPFSIIYITGSRHQTPDTVDERVRDLPPRQHQYQAGSRTNTHPSRQPLRRDHRRDERRRMTDEEDTVMDSQDVSSVDRGELHVLSEFITNSESRFANSLTDMHHFVFK